MQLKQFYNIATKVSSRKSATTFGDLPDCSGVFFFKVSSVKPISEIWSAIYRHLGPQKLMLLFSFSEKLSSVINKVFRAKGVIAATSSILCRLDSWR